MLAIDSLTGRYRDLRLIDLPDLLGEGDLLVVNDAATLPASLRGEIGGAPVELRLVAHIDGTRWTAVLFGAGDWRMATENRPPPPLVTEAERIALGPHLDAIVRGVSAMSPRLLDIELSSAADDPLERVYALGRPIQYSYLRGDLSLWSVQTQYGARPWAVEMPSAGRPLSWSLLLELRRRGVAIARITHAAGISSTGDPAIDAALPLPERYDIPAETVEATAATRARGGRVIAVGTTVVRALEGATAAGDDLVPGAGITDLRVDNEHTLRVVDGLLTGMHDPDASHFELVTAFAERDALLASWNHAVAEGYLCHEFGDVTLVLPPRTGIARAY